MAKFTFIDLFSGIGGFRIGAQMHGGECIGYSEIDKTAIKYYKENFGDGEDNFGDITKIADIPHADLLTGGVPCQSWSIAGKKLGFDDKRGMLWEDTINILEKVRPNAFIFENVKGLSDPRNKEAMEHISKRINDAGYHFRKCVINANDHGTPQDRVRMYLVGFKDKKHYDLFVEPNAHPEHEKATLAEFLDGITHKNPSFDNQFSLNDQRRSENTIHSWELKDTTDSEKKICELIIRNRRKKKYGTHDGNPMSFDDLKELDNGIKIEDIESLCEKGILKKVKHAYKVKQGANAEDEAHRLIIEKANGLGEVIPKTLKNDRDVKISKLNVDKEIAKMLAEGILEQTPIFKYDLVNAKISSGIDGVYRIILPGSTTFPTMVASDTRDMVATETISSNDKETFIKEIYEKGKFRKITKTEACRLQGFPENFTLPEKRPSWMKLIGNSVSVNVVSELVEQIKKTGALNE